MYTSAYTPPPEAQTPLESFSTGALIDRLIAHRRLVEAQNPSTSPPRYSQPERFYQQLGTLRSRMHTGVLNRFLIQPEEEREQDKILSKPAKDAIITELERRGGSGRLATHRHEYQTQTIHNVGRLALATTLTVITGALALFPTGLLQILGIAGFIPSAYKTAQEVDALRHTRARYLELGRTVLDRETNHRMHRVTLNEI